MRLAAAHDEEYRGYLMIEAEREGITSLSPEQISLRRQRRDANRVLKVQEMEDRARKLKREYRLRLIHDD